MTAGIFIGIVIGIVISYIVFNLAIYQVSKDLDRKERMYDNDNELYY